MLLTIASVIYVLVAVAMIVLILMQRGAGAAAGSGFGAGASATVFGARGSANFLSSATKWLAVVFFAMSLGMAWYAQHGGKPAADAVEDIGAMSDVPAAPAPATDVPAAEVPVIPAAETPADVPAADAVPASDAEAAPAADAPAPGGTGIWPRPHSSQWVGRSEASPSAASADFASNSAAAWSESKQADIHALSWLSLVGRPFNAVANNANFIPIPPDSQSARHFRRPCRYDNRASLPHPCSCAKWLLARNRRRFVRCYFSAPSRCRRICWPVFRDWPWDFGGYSLAPCRNSWPHLMT